MSNKNISPFTGNFYFSAVANDILTFIIKEPTAQSESLTFSGITVFIEYL